MNLIKKLASAVVVILALNFVGMAIAGVMLAQQANLTAEKWQAVKDVLYPPEGEYDENAEEDAEPEPPTPMEQLVALLDEQSGKPAESRVTDMNLELDERLAEATRRERELIDRERTVQMAMRQLAADRKSFETQREAWQQAITDVRDRESDEGFQSSLALYESMQSKQVKAIFIDLDDETVLSYLRAMEPRQASKILKEYKSPAEVERARSILEKLREGEAASIAAAAVRNAEALKQATGQGANVGAATPNGLVANDGTDPFAEPGR